MCTSQWAKPLLAVLLDVGGSSPILTRQALPALATAALSQWGSAAPALPSASHRGLGQANAPAPPACAPAAEDGDHLTESVDAAGASSGPLHQSSVVCAPPNVRVAHVEVARCRCSITDAGASLALASCYSTKGNRRGNVECISSQDSCTLSGRQIPAAPAPLPRATLLHPHGPSPTPSLLPAASRSCHLHKPCQQATHTHTRTHTLRPTAAAAATGPTLVHARAHTAGAGTPPSSSSSSSSSPSSAAAAKGASVDAREAAKFAALAASWWRSGEGPFAPLHALNPARVRFVRHSLAAALGLDAAAPEPLSGLRVLDVGCGGGILSESLARLGAQVHGIDVTRENVEAARLHAANDPRVAARVRYDVVSAEDLAASDAAPYDVVVASEVLEHVSKPHQLLAVLASLLEPPERRAGVAAAAAAAADDEVAGSDGGGSDGDGGGRGGALIVSTLNRTPAAWAVAIAGAEYVARIVPAGTHAWHKFITPEELAIMADACGMRVWHAAGMAPTGPRMSWELTPDLSVNYIATLLPRRRTTTDAEAAKAEAPPPPSEQH